MAVTVVGIEDTIGGAVNKFGEVLGDVLDKTVFAKGLREKELRKEPSAMQALLPGVRAAMRRGPDALAAMAKGINVNVDFLEEINAGFTLTNDQEAAENFGLSSGPALVAGQAVSEALLGQATAQAAFDAGNPALKAIADANGFKFDAANSELDLEILNIRRENGVITSILKEEELTAKLGAQTSDAMLTLLANIDQSTEEGQRAAMEFVLSIKGPALLNHLANHERMAFEGSQALARASLTDTDRIATSEKLLQLWQTSIDRLQEADEVGDEGLLTIAVADVNTVRLMIQQANESGIVFDAIDTSVASLGKKLFGGARLELAASTFQTSTGAAFISDFMKQHEELETIPTLEEVEKILSSEQSRQDPELTPAVREDILRQFPGFLADLESLQFEDVSIFSAGTVGGEAIRRVPGVQSVGAAFDGLGRFYKTLSFELQSATNELRRPAGARGDVGGFRSGGARRPITSGSSGR